MEAPQQQEQENEDDTRLAIVLLFGVFHINKIDKTHLVVDNVSGPCVDDPHHGFVTVHSYCAGIFDRHDDTTTKPQTPHSCTSPTSRPQSHLDRLWRRHSPTWIAKRTRRQTRHVSSSSGFRRLHPGGIHHQHATSHHTQVPSVETPCPVLYHLASCFGWGNSLLVAPHGRSSTPTKLQRCGRGTSRAGTAVLVVNGGCSVCTQWEEPQEPQEQPSKRRQQYSVLDWTRRVASSCACLGQALFLETIANGTTTRTSTTTTTTRAAQSKPPPPPRSTTTTTLDTPGPGIPSAGVHPFVHHHHNNNDFVSTQTKKLGSSRPFRSTVGFVVFVFSSRRTTSTTSTSLDHSNPRRSFFRSIFLVPCFTSQPDPKVATPTTTTTTRTTATNPRTGTTVAGFVLVYLSSPARKICRGTSPSPPGSTGTSLR